MTAKLRHNEAECESEPVPGFERLNYYFGQQLGVSDFRDEQNYFREKLKLHNRCLHGHGVVSGLHVSLPDPSSAAESSGARTAVPAKPGEAQPRFVVWISSGLALDPDGNEIYLPNRTQIDLWSLLPDELRTKWNDLKPGDTLLPVVLALKHKDLLARPRRPAAISSCELPRDREYGRIRDGVCAVLLPTNPFPVAGANENCDTCGTVGETVVVLARVTLRKGKDLTAADICSKDRRPVSRYPFNRVAGVNWVHGGHYEPECANELLTESGLRVTFARKVLAAPLHENSRHHRASGAVDILVFSRNVDGQVVSQPVDAYWEVDDAGYIQEVTFKVSQDLLVNRHCRVHVVLRGAFLIDPCCQPLDGTNVGGAVPYLKPACADRWKHAPQSHPLPKSCRVGDEMVGPWTIGASAPGSNFESWFYIPGIHASAPKEVK